MTDNELRNEIERRAHRTIGTIAVCFGLAFLAASLFTQHLVGNSGLTMIIVVAVTGIGAISQLMRRHFVTGAIVQATLAFATATFALAMTGSTACIVGSLLIAFGGYARVNGNVVEPVVYVAPIEQGRKYVYRDNKVVAIEEWHDGHLVSTRPFTPQIAA